MAILMVRLQIKLRAGRSNCSPLKRAAVPRLPAGRPFRCCAQVEKD